MADEKSSGGGKKKGLLGSVWIQLGLRSDGLKEHLANAKKAITNAFKKDPVEDFNEEVEETKFSADELTSKFEGLAATLATVFAVDKLKDFMTACSDSIREQQYAEQKLTATMQSRFNSTQQEIEAIKDLATEMEGIYGISDKITLAGANTLATYVDSAEVVESMIPMMDLIARNRFGIGEISSEDMADIGKTLGEVFVEGGLEPLKGLNIGINELDSEKFKTLSTDAEKIAYVTDLIKSRATDINGILSDTLTIDGLLNNEVDELKENLGSISQLFLVPMKNILLSITRDVNETLGTIANVLGVKMVQAETATNNAAQASSKYFKQANKEAKELKTTVMSFDVFQKLNLTEDEDSDSSFDALAGLDTSTAITQPVKFEYEEGSFADRISKALGKIGDGISKYIGDKFGIAFNEETIEKFVSKLEELGNWIEENPEEFAKFCDTILGIVKALGALIIITSVIKWLGNLAFAFNNLGAFFSGFGTTAAAAGSTFAGLGTSIAGVGATATSVFSGLGAILTNPWVLAAAAIVAVIALIYNFWDEIEAFGHKVEKFFSGLFEKLGNWISNAAQAVSNFFKGLSDNDAEVKVTGHRAGSEVKVRDSGGHDMGERGSSGRSVPLKNLEHLANGGYLEANTPTLAVVGDNLNEGEVVAPESKLRETVSQGMNNSEILKYLSYLPWLPKIFEAITGQSSELTLDKETLTKLVFKTAKQIERATGQPVF